MTPRKETLEIDGAGAVFGLWLQPIGAKACQMLEHGAWAGMEHKAMAALADGLAERAIATLRYQFPYMERGSKRPDPLAVAHAAARATCADAARRAASLPLFAGGSPSAGA